MIHAGLSSLGASYWGAFFIPWESRMEVWQPLCMILPLLPCCWASMRYQSTSFGALSSAKTSSSSWGLIHSSKDWCVPRTCVTFTWLPEDAASSMRTVPHLWAWRLGWATGRIAKQCGMGLGMSVPGNFGRPCLPEHAGRITGGAEQKSYKLKSTFRVLALTGAARLEAGKLHSTKVECGQSCLSKNCV